MTSLPRPLVFLFLLLPTILFAGVERIEITSREPVLAGAGMAAIRDFVSLMRYGGEGGEQLAQLDLADIEQKWSGKFGQSVKVVFEDWEAV